MFTFLFGLRRFLQRTENRRRRRSQQTHVKEPPHESAPMNRQINQWFGAGKQLPSRRRPSSVRLAVETLEDRTAPAVFTVTSFSEGPGGLRDAVLQAKANADASNTINLAAGTYTLTGALLLDSPIVLDIKTYEILGAGEQDTIIQGDGSDRVFDIYGHANFMRVNVWMQNLSIKGGRAHDSGGDNPAGFSFGGGILIRGFGGGVGWGANVILDHVTIEDNQAIGVAGTQGNHAKAGLAAGGGIFVEAGSLTLLNCTIVNNLAAGGNGLAGAEATQFSPGGPAGDGGDALGGGIYVLHGGFLRGDSSTWTMGPGPDRLLVQNSTISNNRAEGGAGGQGGSATNIGSATLSGGAGGNGGGAFGAGIAIGPPLFEQEPENPGNPRLGVWFFNSDVSTNTARGGNGGFGGNGSNGFAAPGGHAGSGGAGGDARGGGIFDLGSGILALNVVDSSLIDNSALGGNGAGGGQGGVGNPGGGAGGGGDGGAAQGGGIFATFTRLFVSNSTMP